MIYAVQLSRLAQKQLGKVPAYIASKLKSWVDAVESEGLEEVRKIPGYHDEPLHGKRVGERSIKLSKSYRAIYTIQQDHTIEFVMIEEVNKHDY